MKVMLSFRNYFILVCLSVISLNSYGNIATDQNWIEQLKEQKIDIAQQSYCYNDEQGKLEGQNVDLRIRLASVSKLLTSLWTIETLGLDHKYNTKLYIKGNRLHIEGSFDPFLGDEKMFFLISQLNELGYEKFDSITFDKNVIVFPGAQYYVEKYPVLNAAIIEKYIKDYFNTSSWSADTKDEYKHYYDIAKPGRYRKEVHFEATNVSFVEKNPYEHDDNVKVLTLSSPPLYKYLKEMNVKSNNYVAETFFHQMGGTVPFQRYLDERYNLKQNQIQFFSGSGLPTIIDGVRKDNYATCSIILKLISELKLSVEKQKKELEDVMAVPGSDAGTFRNRVFPADYKNSFVAKTGTLMHTSALAGAMNTQKGFSFFGIFNQSTDIVGSKTVQNSMVKSIMTELGGPFAFNYVVEDFHTYNGDNVSFLELFNSDNFSSIEGGLY